MENQTIIVTGLSNREFLEEHMRPGCVGLCGGVTALDKVIRRAQRHLDEEKRHSNWSHAFFSQGVRADGHHWVVESDIQILRKHIQLGVQENRVAKYFDEGMFDTLAVLDFGLTEAQTAVLICAGLDLVASHERYSLRELIGTLIALRRPELRSRENPLARERSLYCSAFVQRLFRNAGIDLAPGVTDKYSTPEDISRSPVPHTTYLLVRAPEAGKSGGLAAKLRGHVSSGLQKMKQRARKTAKQ